VADQTRVRTETWFRNPDNYVRELVDAGHRLVVWDRGYLAKKKIDPVRHANNYFAGYPFRILEVGDPTQGCAEYLPGTTHGKPAAVYPVVSFSEDKDPVSVLEELLGSSTGENSELCHDLSTPERERPVFGQEHRVVVTDLPDMSTGRGRAVARALRDLQADYPEAIVHVHGLYSWHTLFGFGFRSVDFEPRSTAQKGKIFLPMGKEIKYEAAGILVNWVSLLGFKPVELSDPKRRCIYNIKSALWAADNYTENQRIRFKRNMSAGPADTSSPDAEFKPETTVAVRTGPKVAALPTDKVTCDTCSLANGCKVYRAGAVCSLTKEGKSLAEMLRSRDSSQIIDGLGAIVGKQAERLERAMEDEEEFQELSPEVTGMLNATFKNGVTLAKLIDPGLRAGPKVAVNVGPGAGNVSVGMAVSPQQLMAGVIAELEAMGIERKDITPPMVQNILRRMNNEQSGDAKAIANERVLEGEVG
jgi:hypothetical protein